MATEDTFITDRQGTKYRVTVDGTAYRAETNPSLVECLERLRRTGETVRVFYGDTRTGAAWQEEHDVSGHIGRSTGSVKTPLIVHPRSHGGPSLLDHCVVAVLAPHGWAWRHPSFTVGEWRVGGHDGSFWTVTHNGKAHARFTTEAKAKRYVAFMTGDRLAK